MNVFCDHTRADGGGISKKYLQGPVLRSATFQSIIAAEKDESNDDGKRENEMKLGHSKPIYITKKYRGG